MAASTLLETALQGHSPYHNFAKRTFDGTKMKGCSNQSRLSKNVSYHEVLVENRED